VTLLFLGALSAGSSANRATGIIVKVLAVFVAAVFSVVAVPSPEALARPLDEVMAAKSIRIIAYRENKPFSWKDEQGKLRGIDVDIAKAIAADLGVRAEIILRMPGESADDDVRVNVWQGPRTGGGVGDVVLHVPYDRDFRIRNTEVVIVNPYFQEQIAVAIHPDMVGENLTFDEFRKDKKIGVQLATVADYFLMTYDGGALIENIAHHTKPKAGVKEFAGKEVAALMGVRSLIEGELHEAGLTPPIIRPNMDGIVRKEWVIAMAVHENSRDLGYRVGDVITKLRESGEMQKIFAKYGITYTSPDGH
jgi:polar amino acid transport system substrate-binding protein